jgi:hypothetical protein
LCWYIFAFKSFFLAKCWAILFLVVIAAQTFSKCVIVLCFTMNQQQIASTLCENRAKPSSGCSGKCQLKKQLQQEEKQENSPYGSGAKEKFEVLLFSDKKPGTHLAISEVVIQPSFPIYAAPISAGMLQGVFHPPQV